MEPPADAALRGALAVGERPALPGSTYGDQPPAPAAGVNAVLMAANLALTVPPSVVTAPMMTTAIAPAIRPYSMAVTPDLLPPRRLRPAAKARMYLRSMLILRDWDTGFSRHRQLRGLRPSPASQRVQKNCPRYDRDNNEAGADTSVWFHTPSKIVLRHSAAHRRNDDGHSCTVARSRGRKRNVTVRHQAAAASVAGRT